MKYREQVSYTAGVVILSLKGLQFHLKDYAPAFYRPPGIGCVNCWTLACIKLP